MTAQPATPNALGSRIVIVGPSCSGKSALGAALADRLGVPFIELDALFRRENWTRPPHEELCAVLRGAHSVEGWVSAGNSLRQTVPVTWPLADTITWLDVGLATTSLSLLRRSLAPMAARASCSGASAGRTFGGSSPSGTPPSGSSATTFRAGHGIASCSNGQGQQRKPLESASCGFVRTTDVEGLLASAG